MMGLRLLVTAISALSLLLSLPDTAAHAAGRPGAGPDKGAHGSQGSREPVRQKELDQAATNQVRSAYRFLEQGKPDKAIKELEKARRMAPDNYWVNYYSAGAYHQLKDYGNARHYWNVAQVSAETPGDRSRVRTAKAFSEYLGGRVDEARLSLRFAVEMDGGNVKARDLLAQIAAPTRAGQPQAAAAVRLGDINEFTGYFMVRMP
jgi:tetratricopeptide (TPR) repeat protein